MGGYQIDEHGLKHYRIDTREMQIYAEVLSQRLEELRETRRA